MCASLDDKGGENKPRRCPTGSAQYPGACWAASVLKLQVKHQVTWAVSQSPRGLSEKQIAVCLPSRSDRVSTSVRLEPLFHSRRTCTGDPWMIEASVRPGSLVQVAEVVLPVSQLWPDPKSRFPTLGGPMDPREQRAANRNGSSFRAALFRRPRDFECAG